MAEEGFSRRAFLGFGVGGTAAAVLAARWPSSAEAAQAAGPFLHGVASGDPLPDRVILWTRVTPSPDSVPGSGVGPAVEVVWEVARDPAFSTVVAHGGVVTDPSVDHTVHVDVGDLTPGADHWFRFSALGVTSPVGRTRTAPLPETALDCLRLGIVTCAEYEFGYFGAYRLVAGRDDLDAVIHLGDYIYEFGTDYGGLKTPKPGGRSHQPAHECLTLGDYRLRYGSYQLDPDLQALHAAHPVIAMYDDHEVANDTFKNGAQNHSANEGDFGLRAAAAHQAWREWLPVRVDESDPELVYRSFQFGDLVELWMLDERRYRDAQPANALLGYISLDPTINDEDRTMLGATQHEWLERRLMSSTRAWKVLGNPVPFFPIDVGPPLLEAIEGVDDLLKGLTGGLALLPPVPPPLGVDDWSGYAGERQALIATIVDTPVSDVVILTGDFHESFASEIPLDGVSYAVNHASAAVEFVAPAVTSPGLDETLVLAGVPPGVIGAAFEVNLSLSNPWVKFHEGTKSGYGVVEFARDRTQYDFAFLADRHDANTTAQVGASWVSPLGTHRLRAAGGPLPTRARPPSPAIVTAAAAPSPLEPAAAAELPPTGAALPLVAAGAAAAAAAALSRQRRVE